MIAATLVGAARQSLTQSMTVRPPLNRPAGPAGLFVPLDSVAGCHFKTDSLSHWRHLWFLDRNSQRQSQSIQDQVGTVIMVIVALDTSNGDTLATHMAMARFGRDSLGVFSSISNVADQDSTTTRITIEGKVYPAGTRFLTASEFMKARQYAAELWLRGCTGSRTTR